MSGTAQVVADPAAADKVAGFKKLAQQHEKAAAECARFRAYYETSW